MMGKYIDLTGMKFGKWTVIRRVYDKERNATLWECRCECDAIHSVNGRELRNGNSKSCRKCGSVHFGTDNTSYKHGGAKTKLYNVWKSMRQRCNNPNCHDYKWYGGTGVKVCDEWNEFSAFREWALSSGYNEKLTIERIDTLRDYEPENCTWVTMEDQQRNKKNNHNLTYRGETYPMSVWSRKIGMNYSTLRTKVAKGIPFDEIVKSYVVESDDLTEYE